MFALLRATTSASQIVTIWAWRSRSPRPRAAGQPAGPALREPAICAGASTHSAAATKRVVAPSIVRRTKAAGVLLTAVPTISLLALFATQTWSAAAYPMAYWRERLNYTLRPSIVDTSGMLVGFIPPSNVKNLDSAHGAMPGRIPEACVDLVLAREDAHHAEPWRYVSGVDLGGIVRAMVTRRGGASTIPMQLSRQLAPHWPQEHSRPVRKVLEAGAAKAMIDLHGGDHRALARTYLSVAPFAKAYGDVRGIAAAADAFWGVSATELTPAQCAVLVVLLPTRPNIRDSSNEAQVAWMQRMNQAAQLLQQVPGVNAGAEVLALQKWATPPRRALIDGYPEAVSLNLGARTRALVLPHLARIEADAPTQPGVSLLAAASNGPRL